MPYMLGCSTSGRTRVPPCNRSNPTVPSRYYVQNPPTVGQSTIHSHSAAAKIHTRFFRLFVDAVRLICWSYRSSDAMACDVKNCFYSTSHWRTTLRDAGCDSSERTTNFPTKMMKIQRSCYLIDPPSFRRYACSALHIRRLFSIRRRQVLSNSFC